MPDPAAVSALASVWADAEIDVDTHDEWWTSPRSLAEGVLAHPFTPAQRAAIAASVLTPEVLAEAIDQHVHGIGWDRMCTGEDCGAALITALRDAGKEPDRWLTATA